MVVAVALVEPQYEVNVGHVARLMKNFGLQDMYLIDPHFQEEEAVRFSTHGKEILASAKVVTLKQLRKRFDFLIGTTAINATSRLNVLRESISAAQMAQIIKASGKKSFCILLGREASGLNNKELNMCDLVVIIDTKTEYRTMNVAHALAIMLYEISKNAPPKVAKKGRKLMALASKTEINLLIEYVNKVSVKSSYDKHKQPLLNSAVQRLLAKGVPTSKDVMLLVSLLRRSLITIDRNKNKK